MNKNILIGGVSVGVVALIIYFYNKNKGSNTSSNDTKSNMGKTPVGLGWAMFKWSKDVSIPTYSKDSSGKLIEKGKVNFKKGEVSRFKSGSFTIGKDFTEAKLENGDFIKIYESDAPQMF
jgi:hypothetical protein